MLIMYGKFADMKRYKPVDYIKGDFVTNKIHATVWPDTQENRAILLPQVEYMNRHNDGAHFELRTDGGKKI